jgi:hypothetical protein
VSCDVFEDRCAELRNARVRPAPERLLGQQPEEPLVKVRDQGVVRNKSVYLALGVTMHGSKEVLGLWIEQNEGAKFWLKVVNELKTRGVRDILIACCDGLKGFPRPSRRHSRRPSCRPASST